LPERIMSESPALPRSAERPVQPSPAAAPAGQGAWRRLRGLAGALLAAPPGGGPGRRLLIQSLAALLVALVLAAAGGVLPAPLAFLLGAFTLAGGAAAWVWPAPAAPLGAHNVLSAGALPSEPLAVQFDPRARLLLDELLDAILVVAADDRVVLANKAARAVLVDPAYERKFISTVMRRPAVLEAIARVRQTGKPEKAEFIDLVPVERVFEAYVAPLAFPGEPEPLVLVSLRDLTQVKAVEQMRADFVANASHELRTPLSSLSGFIETLRGHAKDDPVARERFLGIMQEQASRMRRLIDDLLSLSRIELNEHVPPSRSVDLRAVAHDVIDAFQPLARDAKITVKLKAEPGLQPAVGDRDELVQVLQNLIDNAIKYGRAETEVLVTLGPGVPAEFAPGILVPHPGSYIAVKDCGQGIAAQHIPRLTERFYRVDVNQSRDRGGTGLGLAIVKHIVNRHRGKLDIKSDLGQGSVFMVVLPAVAGADAPGARGERRHTEVPAGVVKKMS
jgi:two-component system phosphate regulon sensor histidine kinase PhoR